MTEENERTELEKLSDRIDILREMFNIFVMRDHGVALMWWGDYEKLATDLEVEEEGRATAEE